MLLCNVKSMLFLFFSNTCWSPRIYDKLGFLLDLCTICRCISSLQATRNSPKHIAHLLGVGDVIGSILCLNCVVAKDVVPEMSDARHLQQGKCLGSKKYASHYYEQLSVIFWDLYNNKDDNFHSEARRNQTSVLIRDQENQVSP